MTDSRKRKLLLFFISLACLGGAAIFFSSVLGITELVYPLRVDSAYVVARQINAENKLNNKDSLNPYLYLYKPEQLSLAYVPITVKTSDSIVLKGWYFTPSHEESGITILLIHDLNESKINYLLAAKAFTERGFRVCCMDMRASGESEGSYFTLGVLSAKDISVILDSLYGKPETNYIVVIGAGTGAAIAIQAATYDMRPMAFVFQNSFADLTAYFSRFARKKWGWPGKWFFTFMKKELEQQMGFNSDSLNLQEMIKQVNKPTLFIAKAKESIEDLKETHLLFDLSGAEKKEFLFFREPAGKEPTIENQKEYYDKISAFISTSVPKKAQRTRFKKLVIHDYQVNN